VDGILVNVEASESVVIVVVRHASKGSSGGQRSVAPSLFSVSCPTRTERKLQHNSFERRISFIHKQTHTFIALDYY
jgi:hypothetical protein